MTDDRTILVRYDEIGLKGKNRSMFINCLMDNIRHRLADIEGVRLRAPHGRVLIYCSTEQAEQCVVELKSIPGVASSSIGVSMEPDFSAMADLGVEWIEPLLSPGKTLKFCVKTRRADKSFYKISQEVNFEVGSRIMGKLHSKGMEVNINSAEFVLEIEMGQEEKVVFKRRVPGVRGWA